MGLEQYKGDMEMCCRCSTCKFIPLQKVAGYRFANVCPSISRFNFHSYSAGGRLNIGAAMLRDGFNYSDRLMHIVYNCQMCGACGVSCNYAMDMEVMEPIHEFRAKCVEDGKVNPALEQAVQQLREQGSMVDPSAKRGEWAAGLNVKDASRENVEVLYHAGCLASCDKDMQRMARASARILQAAGIDFGIAGDAETCCGGRAYQMGYADDFLNQARKNTAMIRKAGVKTVVTACADCYQAFKVLYDKHGLKQGFEVLHMSEYIDRLIAEGRLALSAKVDMAVTYHDPCRLGRLGEPWIHWQGKKIPGDRFVFDPPKQYRRGTYGVYDPPRRVLKRIPGLRLTEMTRIREYAWCCGAGGGVNVSNPGFAEWTAAERIEEAQTTGAEALVTACPWCVKTLGSAAGQNGGALKVYDIVELVEQAL